MEKQGFRGMRTRASLVFLAVPLMTMSAIAQNTFPATGNVGIGTTSPGYPLTVSGAAAIGDVGTGVEDQSNIPLVSKYLGFTPGDGTVNYILLSYTKTSTGSFTSSGFDGQIHLYRGSEASNNAASLYDIGVKDSYNGYSVMRFNSYGSLSAANLVTLTYGGTSYIAVQVPTASAMDVYVTGRSWGFIPLMAGPSQVTGVTQLAAPYIAVNSHGNVGIATTAPQAQLHVSDAGSLAIDWLGILNNITNSSGSGYGVGLRLQNSTITGGGNEPNKWAGVAAVASGGYSNNTDLAFYTGNFNPGANTTSPPSERVRIQSTTGNVGIGTTAPGYALDVNGAIHAATGVVYPDGSTQTTAWTGVLCGGDYAESVDVTGDRRHYGPGDILVIDPDAPDKFLKSAEPYSTAVLGVYSTKPGVLGRHQTGPANTDEVPMAMVGIVPTKVSAENGAIRPGDLLVTAFTPGYAMKGTDRSRMLGAVVGKAMGSLDSGTGVIEVGVTLQ